MHFVELVKVIGEREHVFKSLVDSDVLVDERVDQYRLEPLDNTKQVNTEFS